eukprot:GHVO01044216.1.p1 GENE.GHVO01044216.1~~GHVO01044216.1.p1  ORF type:complete len:145 (+),score=21.93 GHVO01044216.1:26-436(+)
MGINLSTQRDLPSVYSAEDFLDSVDEPVSMPDNDDFLKCFTVVEKDGKKFYALKEIRGKGKTIKYTPRTFAVREPSSGNASQAFSDNFSQSFPDSQGFSDSASQGFSDSASQAFSEYTGNTSHTASYFESRPTSEV